jgi:hypothetical protein
VHEGFEPEKICPSPLAEQRRIVAKVDELMALVDQLEAQLAKAKADGARLPDAVVAELVQPQAA